jgi:hypothetical protein
MNSIANHRALRTQDSATGPARYPACFDAWFRRELQVEKLIGGPAVGNRIAVARVQHGLFNAKADGSFNLFTVKPIDDQAKRDLLGADFILVELAKGEEAQACANSPVWATE